LKGWPGRGLKEIQRFIVLFKRYKLTFYDLKALSREAEGRIEGSSFI
jgi:hypothetical protein